LEFKNSECARKLDTIATKNSTKFRNNACLFDISQPPARLAFRFAFRVYVFKCPGAVMAFLAASDVRFDIHSNELIASAQTDEAMRAFQSARETIDLTPEDS
jgi:hypothetical protein